MADGIRITESGDFRVTQASDFRITEQLVLGEVALNATGTIAVVGTGQLKGNSALTSTGTIAGLGTGTSRVSIGLNASGDITSAQYTGTWIAAANLTTVGSKLSSAERTQFPTAQLSSTGSVSSIGTRIQYVESALNATGTVVTKGGLLFLKDAVAEASSSIAAIPVGIFKGAFATFPTEDVRVTEAGDTRITEDDNTRVTRLIFGNAGEGTILSLPTTIPFASIAYRYNDEEAEWKTFIPSVKWNNQWTSNLKIYKHTNGAWKRSY